MEKNIFQHHLPGNVCFGCGEDNPSGLHIHSYWQGDEAVCHWQPKEAHQGWQGITCGGIIATLIDCHCMATAMATAVRNEQRELGSEPHYRFATGSMAIKYLQPTSNEHEIELRAHVTEIKNNKKYTLNCRVLSQGTLTAEAEVVAFLVWRSDRPDEGLFA